MDIINKFLLTNAKSKVKSYTTTAFVLGNVVINLKLLLAGVQIKDYKMSDFTGVDYAAAMGALGAVYVGNKTITKPNTTEDKNA
jgi:hypothetical protein